MDFIRLFISCEGRIGRMPYFLGFLALTIASFIVSAVLGSVYGINSEAGIKGFLISLPFTLAYFCLTIKRAHDLGHSGFWLFAWIGAFAASIMLLAGGSLISLGSFAAGTPALVGGGLLMLAATYQLGIKLIFFAGEDGDNEFGAPEGSAGGYSRAPSRSHSSSTAGGGNWMEAAILSVEKEAGSKPAQSAQSAPRSAWPAWPAAAGFGRRTSAPIRR